MDRRSLGAVVVTVMALTGCAAHKGTGGPPPLNVEVTAAQRRTLETHLSLDGQIAPLEQATLSFQQSGPIAAVYVNVGDHVRAGQVLARIDDSTLRAQLAQQEALAAQAAAAAKGQQLDLPLSRRTTAAQVASAKAAMDNALLSYQQTQRLFAQGYVSKSDLEAARAQYVAARSSYQTALAQQSGTEVTAQNVAAAEAAAEAARAQVRLLETEIGQTVLYAPFDGVVSQRLADPGVMATPATPVLQVARIATVWVNVNVPDGDLRYVRPGTLVTFTTSSLPGRTFVGRISAVNAVPTQGTLSYLAQIREPNPDGTLRGGMLVTVTVVKERKPDALVVPLTAVAHLRDGDAVYTIRNGKAVAIPVTVGLTTDTLAAVESSSLAPGTPVITTLSDALHAGSPVTVVRSGEAQ